VWSWVELLGFVLLLIGMFIYNQVITLPFLPDNKQLTQVQLQQETLAEEDDEALEEEGGYQVQKAPVQAANRRPSLPLPPSSPYMRSPRI